VVAATNRDLALEVTAGRFREDLYYRLAVAKVVVPPLRERLDDLPALVEHLLGQLGVDPAPLLTVDSLEALARYPWPGNVRELRNTLERAGTLAEPLRFEPPARAPDGADLSVPLRVGKQRLIERYEREYLTAAFAECRGNISEVARRAGLERISVYRMLKRLGLSPRDPE
jgi:DNA-binding NtrC family response regulator